MKNSKTCSKCSCTKLLRVDDVYGDRSINLILGFLSSVPVTRYVCTGCGYVESWVDDRYIREVREKYEKEQQKK